MILHTSTMLFFFVYLPFLADCLFVYSPRCHSDRKIWYTIQAFFLGDRLVTPRKVWGTSRELDFLQVLFYAAQRMMSQLCFQSWLESVGCFFCAFIFFWLYSAFRELEDAQCKRAGWERPNLQLTNALSLAQLTLMRICICILYLHSFFSK